MTIAQRITLKQFPQGEPQDDDFEMFSEELGNPGDGELLIEVSHLSIDAFIRTTLGSGGLHTQAHTGDPVTALGVGKVLESAHPNFLPGDWVVGPTLAQTHALLPGAMFQKIEPGNASPTLFLGLLGMTTGLTAYAGMCHVGRVTSGDTVVVSAAGGAVGSVACQLAKHSGARVIGIAGGPAKCQYLLDDVGCDVAIDYKNQDVAKALDEAAPDGINVFFDNVGGELLDTVLDRIATGARVVICGAISQYDDLNDVRGPNLYLRIAERNASMLGFTVDHFTNDFPVFISQMTQWMDQGLHLHEQELNGLESFPEALRTLFNGGHMGKMLVAVRQN
ncbi:MAG: NADP-dependent oxidoreductase [Pseudomonadales bacterium]